MYFFIDPEFEQWLDNTQSFIDNVDAELDAMADYFENLFSSAEAAEKELNFLLSDLED